MKFADLSKSQKSALVKESTLLRLGVTLLSLSLTMEVTIVTEMMQAAPESSTHEKLSLKIRQSERKP